LFTSILLLSAGWALAQYSSGSDNSAAGSSDSNTGAYSGSSAGSETSSGEASQQGSKSSSMAPQGSTISDKIQGCLSESNGKFTLTDNSGTAYQLTGKTANLKAHVGHTIEVTGKTSGANAPGSMSGEQSSMEQTLQVTSFKHVSSNCKSQMH
jgi:hypothetical protein